MIADASPAKSTESRHRVRLRRLRKTLCRYLTLVTPESGSKRVLLLASETALELEVRAALQNLQRDGESSIFFGLVYLDPTYADFYQSSSSWIISRKEFLMQCTLCLPLLRGRVLATLVFRVSAPFVPGPLRLAFVLCRE